MSDVNITVSKNGPNLVQGKVTIKGSDGEVIREVDGNVALCRCGHSQDKPFCDGSHKDAGFQAPGPKSG